MYCNLRPPEPCQHLPAFITRPCQVWSRWTYSLPYYGAFAAITLLHAVTLTLTLWPWPLTYDREHLQHIACDVVKLSAKFERNRTIRGGVIAISVFVTLWPWPLTSWSWTFTAGIPCFKLCTKFERNRIIHGWVDDLARFRAQF